MARLLRPRDQGRGPEAAEPQPLSPSLPPVQKAARPRRLSAVDPELSPRPPPGPRKDPSRFASGHAPLDEGDAGALPAVSYWSESTSSPLSPTSPRGARKDASRFSSWHGTRGVVAADELPSAAAYSSEPSRASGVAPAAPPRAEEVAAPPEESATSRLDPSKFASWNSTRDSAWSGPSRERRRSVGSKEASTSAGASAAPMPLMQKANSMREARRPAPSADASQAATMQKAISDGRRCAKPPDSPRGKTSAAAARARIRMRLRRRPEEAPADAEGRPARTTEDLDNDFEEIFSGDLDWVAKQQLEKQSRDKYYSNMESIWASERDTELAEGDEELSRQTSGLSQGSDRQ